jgi:integrase
MMQYHGIYAELIEQYITFKRSLGYALENVYTFSMFDRFTVEHNVSAIGLTRELTDKWAEKRTNDSDVTRYKRVNDIANFSKFLNHIGYPSYIPRQMKAYHSTFTPHIFSKEELNAFFHACDCLEITGYSNATYILPAAFRMIYGCGLRTNEAMSLRCRDVNLEKNYIIIRKPKNGRDRMLPLSDS